MGNAGMQYGLAMYQKWEDYVRLFGPVESAIEALPTGGGNSLIFEDITLVPFDDLEAIERFGLEVAEEQAYPVPIVYTSRGGAKRPTSANQIWFEAALQAIPLFLRDRGPLRRAHVDLFHGSTDPIRLGGLLSVASAFAAGAVRPDAAGPSATPAPVCRPRVDGGDCLPDDLLWLQPVRDDLVPVLPRVQ